MKAWKPHTTEKFPPDYNIFREKIEQTVAVNTSAVSTTTGTNRENNKRSDKETKNRASAISPSILHNYFRLQLHPTFSLYGIVVVENILTFRIKNHNFVLCLF